MPTSKFIRTVEVARILNCRYQKARDRMLTGQFGTVVVDSSNKMTVDEKLVRAAKKNIDKLKARRV